MDIGVWTQDLSWDSLYCIIQVILFCMDYSCEQENTQSQSNTLEFHQTVMTLIGSCKPWRCNLLVSRHNNWESFVTINHIIYSSLVSSCDSEQQRRRSYSGHALAHSRVKQPERLQPTGIKMSLLYKIDSPCHVPTNPPLPPAAPTTQSWSLSPVFSPSR